MNIRILYSTSSALLVEVLIYRLLYRYFSMLGLFLSTEGLKKSRMVRRSDLFGANGEGTYWFPRILSAEPNLVKFHDNVRVASDVYFCIYAVVKRMINAVSEYYEMLSESVRKLGGSRSFTTASLVPRSSSCMA